MKIKIGFLACLLTIFLLTSCEEFKITEEGITYIPIEEIKIEKEKLPSGTVELSISDGIVSYYLEDIPLMEDKAYEGWIIDKEADIKESTGIIKVDENGSGRVSYGAGKDISDFDSIMVTLESIPDLDPEPSDIIVLKADITGEGDKRIIELTPAVIIEEKPEEEEIFLPEEIIGEEIEIPEVEIPTEEIIEIPEEVKEEAIVIIVEETDLVSLVPKATDPDADLLKYSFTTPLNENGEWQTNYGDAGEYTIAVTASDGVLSTSKDVLLIVNKKEEAPIIDEAIPKEETLKADENTELKFSAKASDKNKDPLTYSWKLDGTEVSTKKEYEHIIGFEDAGSHTIKLDISDGTLTTSRIWSLTVNNVNRDPILERLEDIRVKETETVTIKPRATDPDNDALTFTISDPVGNDDIWETTYDDSGVYDITVTASDGTTIKSQTLKITVENVNRPPVIVEIVQR